MEFAKVTAIIRRTVVENVEMALEKAVSAGSQGFSGFGAKPSQNPAKFSTSGYGAFNYIDAITKQQPLRICVILS